MAMLILLNKILYFAVVLIYIVASVLFVHLAKASLTVKSTGPLTSFLNNVRQGLKI